MLPLAIHLSRCFKVIFSVCRASGLSAPIIVIAETANSGYNPPMNVKMTPIKKPFRRSLGLTGSVAISSAAISIGAFMSCLKYQSNPWDNQTPRNIPIALPVIPNISTSYRNNRKICRFLKPILLSTPISYRLSLIVILMALKIKNIIASKVVAPAKKRPAFIPDKDASFCSKMLCFGANTVRSWSFTTSSILFCTSRHSSAYSGFICTII